MENKTRKINIKFVELLKLIEVAKDRIESSLKYPRKEWEEVENFLFTLNEEDFTDFALLCLTGETNE